MRNPESMNFDPTADFELTDSRGAEDMLEGELEEQVAERISRLEAFHEQLVTFAQDPDIQVEAMPLVKKVSDEIEKMITEVESLDSQEMEDRLEELKEDLEAVGVSIAEEHERMFA